MTGTIQIFNADVYATPSTVLEHQIGAMGVDEFGDLYRYAKVGAVAISAGKLQMAPTQKTNHHNCAASAAVTANGRNKAVTLTLGATAAVAQEYAFGILAANDNTPEGQSYRILSHPAANSAATLAVTVERPFITSITTSSEFTLVHNTWNAVVEDTTITKRAAGVPMVPAGIGTYVWLKTRGIAATLIGSAATLGAPLIASSGTAGAVTDQTDILGASAELTIGWASVAAGVSTEYNPIQLTID
jgi:hypothetical protein